MDIPCFIQNPPSDTEMETALLMATGNGVKRVSQLRNMAEDSIRGHVKALRYKFHTDCITVALLRMVALKYLPGEVLLKQLPDGWQQYIKP